MRGIAAMCDSVFLVGDDGSLAEMTSALLYRAERPRPPSYGRCWHPPARIGAMRVLRLRWVDGQDS